MTVQEMHTAFKILLDKVDSLSYPNFEDVEIDFFLNKESERFIKHRAEGSHNKNVGFEETQKRMDDLRNITENVILTPDPVTTANKPNGRFVSLPSLAPNIYWFAINEEAKVRVKKCSSKKVLNGEIEDSETYFVESGSIVYNSVNYSSGELFTGTTGSVNGVPFPITTFTGTGCAFPTVIEIVEIKPLQHDDYNKTIKDPFNKSIVTNQVKQLRRLQLASRMEILLPENVFLNEYILRYIRKPVKISLTSLVDSDLADHTHQEIVDMAVSSVLETIESGRYQSHLNELNKLE